MFYFCCNLSEIIRFTGTQYAGESPDSKCNVHFTSQSLHSCWQLLLFADARSVCLQRRSLHRGGLEWNPKTPWQCQGQRPSQGWPFWTGLQVCVSSHRSVNARLELGSFATSLCLPNETKPSSALRVACQDSTAVLGQGKYNPRTLSGVWDIFCLRLSFIFFYLFSFHYFHSCILTLRVRKLRSPMNRAQSCQRFCLLILEKVRI